MQKQKLNQQQKLAIGSLQIQFLNLLQTPIADLNKRIEEELEKNPALEESINTDIDQSRNEPNIKNHIIKDYSGKQLTNKEESLSDFLHNQLIGVRLEQKKLFLIKYLIDSLDDNGFLSRDLHSISSDLLSNNIAVSENELIDSLLFLQKLDPSGVGARNLQECLLVQLNKKKNTTSIDLAKKILKEHYNAFTNKNFEKLITTLKISQDELKSVYSEVQKLNPFPGNGFAKQDSVFRFITADFIIKTEGGKLIMKMGGGYEKKLNISPYYQRMLEETNDDDAKKFLIKKIEGAKWFKQAINDRLHTLEKVMNAILKLQKAYLQIHLQRSLV